MVPKTVIDTWRADFADAGFAMRSVEVRGLIFFYFVIARNWKKLPPALPELFAFQMVPDTGPITPTTALFAVSAEIPREYQDLTVLHEVEEFAEQYVRTAQQYALVGAELPERLPRACVHASFAEYLAMQTRPPTFWPGYTDMRVEFFRTLIAYCEQANMKPEIVDGYRESAQFWLACQQTGGKLIFPPPSL